MDASEASVFSRGVQDAREICDGLATSQRRCQFGEIVGIGLNDLSGRSESTVTMRMACDDATGITAVSEVVG